MDIISTIKYCFHFLKSTRCRLYGPYTIVGHLRDIALILIWSDVRSGGQNVVNVLKKMSIRKVIQISRDEISI